MFIKKYFLPMELDVHARGGMLRRIAARQRDEPVERPALQVMEPQRCRHAARHGALARCGGAVDGNDWNAHFEMLASTAKYSGKVFATHSGSLIVTGTPPSAASEKHIAMR